MRRRAAKGAAWPPPGLFPDPPGAKRRAGARAREARTVELTLFVHRVLEASYLVSLTGEAGEEPKTLPFSLGVPRVEAEAGRTGDFTMPLWVAKDRGWVAP